MAFLKKIFYYSLVFFLCFSFLSLGSGNFMLLAQTRPTEKGALMLSGYGDFSSIGGDLSSSSSSRDSQLYLTLSANNFILNNFFAGIGLEISFLSGSGTTNSTFGIGPQLGLALGNKNGSSFPYLITGIRYVNSNFSFTGLSASTSGSNLFGGVGLVVPIFKHIAATGELSFNNYTFKDDNYKLKGNVFQVSLGFSGLFYKSDT